MIGGLVSGGRVVVGTAVVAIVVLVDEGAVEPEVPVVGTEVEVVVDTVVVVEVVTHATTGSLANVRSGSTPLRLTQTRAVTSKGARTWIQSPESSRPVA
jgi:hypothetical protein